MKLIIETNSFTLFKRTSEKYYKNIDNLELIKIDCETNFDILNFQNLFSTTSLFDDNKIIILLNFDFSNFKKEKELNLIKSIFSSSSNNSLIIHSSKIAKKDKLFEDIKNNFEYFYIPKPENKKELETFIKNWSTKHNINFSKMALVKLIDNAKENFEIIVNELEKILLLEQNNITEEDIAKISYDFKGESIFNIIDGLLKKNSKMISESFQQLINFSIQPFLILNRIIDDLTLMAMIKKMNSSHQKISEILNIHIFRISKLGNNINNFSSEQLSKLIEKFIKLKIDLVSSKRDEQTNIRYLKNKLANLF